MPLITLSLNKNSLRTPQIYLNFLTLSKIPDFAFFFFEDAAAIFFFNVQSSIW